MTNAVSRARLALRLLAIDPQGLGGVHLRARPGPVRAALEDDMGALPVPVRRIHPSISDEQLYGGIDLSATLAQGVAVRSKGLLDAPCTVILPMAERCPSGLAARLGLALDRGSHAIIALDEGAEPDEILPAALADRLAFSVELEELSMRDVQAADPMPAAPTNDADAHEILVPSGAIADLAGLAETLGIVSPRACLLALRAARAHAVLAGRDCVAEEDLTVAAALVLAPRATRMPETDASDQTPPPEDAPPPPPQDAPEQDGEDSQSPGEDTMIPAELLLEAAMAVLPPDLLARLAVGRTSGARAGGSGSGQAQKGNRRGRPLPSRAGRLDGSSRLDLIGTLRAAAPWQTVRRRSARVKQTLHVRSSDFRIKRYKEMSDRLLIFVVDASGSAAMTRLAEAKGAVELLLGEAYARRDHVARVAFRGEGAEVLLPPTRSLVQTKRRLAALPGGGGTPLAAGLQAAMELGTSARGKGMTPTIAVLTDGRANIALDGHADRQAAGADATKLARLIRASDIPSLVIDMAPRPQRPLRALAEVMDAPYIPLPRADANRLSTAVSAALDA